MSNIFQDVFQRQTKRSLICDCCCCFGAPSLLQVQSTILKDFFTLKPFLGIIEQEKLQILHLLSNQQKKYCHQNFNPLRWSQESQRRTRMCICQKFSWEVRCYSCETYTLIIRCSKKLIDEKWTPTHTTDNYCTPRKTNPQFRKSITENQRRLKFKNNFPS